VSFALIAALLGACCSGTAAIAQAQAATSEPARDGLHVELLARLVRRPRYLVALALVAAGFGLSVVALHSLPLFVVQSARASSLAVTALLAVTLLHARLSRIEVGAVAAVVGGIVVLGASAGAGGSSTATSGARVDLVIGLCVAAAAGVGAARIRPVARSGLALGGIAGLAFALVALGARVLHTSSVAAVLTDPAAWTMGCAAILGLLLGATALQRTSVVAATAPMVAIETVVAAGLGMILCGDRPAPGEGLSAAVGFVLVLAGALSLARFASLPPGPRPVELEPSRDGGRA